MHSHERHFHIRRLSNLRAQDFWRTASEHVFNGTASDLGLINGIGVRDTNMRVPNKMKMRARFMQNMQAGAKPERQTKTQPSNDNTNSISDYIIRRRRSADKLDIRPEDWLTKFVNKKRPKRNAVFMKKSLQPVKHVGPIKNDQAYTTVGLKFLRSQTNNMLHNDKVACMRRSSTGVLAILKKFPASFFKPNKTDLIICVLETILSRLIMTSVFVKDYIVLYRKFYRHPNFGFNYRSKSADKAENWLSARKAILLRSATFKEFLENMCRRYDTLRQHSDPPLLRSQLFAQNTGTRIVVHGADQKRRTISRHTKQVKYNFSFLSQNKEVRHFTRIVKNFNKSHEFKLSVFAAAEPQSKKKNNLIMKKKHHPENKLHPNKSKRVDTLQDNKAATLKENIVVNIFQKIIHKRMIAQQSEKKIKARQFFMKTVKKTVIFTRMMKPPVVSQSFTEGDEQRLTNKPKHDSKSVLVDINVLFKMPRTMHRNSVEKISAAGQDLFIRATRSVPKILSFSKKRLQPII